MELGCHARSNPLLSLLLSTDIHLLCCDRGPGGQDWMLIIMIVLNWNIVMVCCVKWLLFKILVCFSDKKKRV